MTLRQVRERYSPKLTRFRITMLILHILAWGLLISGATDLATAFINTFYLHAAFAIQWSQMTSTLLGFMISQAGNALGRYFKTEEDRDNPPTNPTDEEQS